MAQLKYDKFQRLKEMGREPIDLPADINFGGNEKRQKTPGRHHRQEFQATGTYYHPNLCAQRVREAEDRLQRLRDLKMSQAEIKKHGDDESKLEQKLEAAVAEYKGVLSGKSNNPEIVAMHKAVFGGRKMSALESAMSTFNSDAAPAPSTTSSEDDKDKANPDLMINKSKQIPSAKS